MVTTRLSYRLVSKSTRPVDLPRSRGSRGAEGASRIAAVVFAIVPSVACVDPPGNDPNVPDYAAFEAGPGASCPHGAPAGCAAPPSYSQSIAPLVTRTCLPCHAPGGVASDRDLSMYAKLTRLETTVISQVNGCLMPPADAGPDAMMTAADRTELVQWFVCGAPNN